MYLHASFREVVLSYPVEELVLHVPSSQVASFLVAEPCLVANLEVGTFPVVVEVGVVQPRLEHLLVLEPSFGMTVLPPHELVLGDLVEWSRVEQRAFHVQQPVPCRVQELLQEWELEEDPHPVEVGLRQ
jgi:hypothetical protein